MFNKSLNLNKVMPLYLNYLFKKTYCRDMPLSVFINKHFTFAKG